MKKIILTKGMVARVDSSDFDNLNRYSWYYGSGGYACRGVGSWRRGEHRILYMHREILNPPKTLKIDHRNGDGINNRRSNLRKCTHAQNIRNHRLNSRNKTGFHGVHWDSARSKFVASIKLNLKTVALGRFDTAKQASEVRERAAKQHWGEFAPSKK